MSKSNFFEHDGEGYGDGCGWGDGDGDGWGDGAFCQWSVLE